MAQAGTIGKCLRFAIIVLFLFREILEVLLEMGTAVLLMPFNCTYELTFLLTLSPILLDSGNSNQIRVISYRYELNFLKPH